MSRLTFAEFRAANKARRDAWRERDGAAPWSGADWGNEMAGEVGEACNVVKKLRRAETGVAGIGDRPPEELRQMLADELADVLITADLVAMFYDIDLEAALARKFNAVSKKQGLPQMLPYKVPLPTLAEWDLDHPKAEPSCRICDYAEALDHHRSPSAKGYHPFIPQEADSSASLDALEAGK